MKHSFALGQEVKHHKGGRYIILALPNEKKLEYCNESFYEYTSLADEAIWLRRQSEMEDGRFIPVE